MASIVKDQPKTHQSFDYLIFSLWELNLRKSPSGNFIEKDAI